MCEKTPTSSLELSFVTELLLDAFSNLRKEIKKLNTNRIRNPIICLDGHWTVLILEPMSKNKGDNLLVLFEVSEANKGQLISHKGLRSGECLYIAFVVFDLIEVAGVYVTAELWDHRGNRCEMGGRGRGRKTEKEVNRRKKEVLRKRKDQMFHGAAAVPQDLCDFCLSHTKSF